ncbi:MAG: hypothetical protein LBO06_06405 [Bacteroidales bacterium]|jgi:hypothetical protein|nr:hypothetical protein [Bacteroidales bacterium]
MTTRVEFMSMVYLSMNKKEIKELADKLVEENFPIENVFEISFSPDPQSSFHCSLVLEALFIKDPALLDPILDDLFGKYNQVKHYTTARTFGKILTNIYRLKQQKHATPKMLEVTDGKYDDAVIEGCFKQLNVKEIKISVAIWQLQLLVNFMNKKNAWIKEEVTAVIGRMSQTDAPSIAAFVKKYSSKIAKL